MRYGTGLRNCNDVTAADGPGQRNSGCRATVCCANTCKRGITQQAGGGAAEWRIGHHRHAVLLAPWQQVMFDAAVADVVRDLISRTAIAFWNTEQVLHVADLIARPAEPWPNAGITVPSRNLTVRPAAVEATPLAASRADAPDEVTNELSATQSPLNSRRFSSLVSLPFTTRSLPLRRSCSVVNMVQPVVLLSGCVRPENLHRLKVATERRWRTRIAGVNPQ